MYQIRKIVNDTVAMLIENLENSNEIHMHIYLCAIGNLKYEYAKQKPNLFQETCEKQNMFVKL